jgi:hypothetical protein
MRLPASGFSHAGVLFVYIIYIIIYIYFFIRDTAGDRNPRYDVP